MNKPKKQKRSPLKRKPLRNPGQSIHEEIQHIFIGRQLPLIVIAASSVGFALSEWSRRLFSTEPHPLAASLIALFIVPCCAYALVRSRARVEQMEQGIDGEKFIAQFLEAERSDRWRVYNDIPCNGFNIDHVLIAPQGIFAIETKTFSKPDRGEATAQYDGDRILVNGREPDRDPIKQARAVRNSLGDILHSPGRKDYTVRGVVLLPGWYIEPPKDQRRADVWVLNEKAFIKFVQYEPEVLSDDDIDRATNRLIDFVTR